MPDDRYHAIYFAMLLAGVGFLLPYNSFITDVDYLHHKYPGGSPAATSCHRVPPRTLGSGLPPSCTISTQVGPPQPRPAIACRPAHLAQACHPPAPQVPRWVPRSHILPSRAALHTWLWPATFQKPLGQDPTRGAHFLQTLARL